jgi:hypothetical protein
MVHKSSSAARSRRRSRCRQLALICGVFSYLATFTAGVLALLAFAAPTGGAAVTALEVAAGLLVATLVLWAVDLYAALHPRPPSGARIA